MHSHSGRYVIVYNGEIYNHGDMRRELDSATGSHVNWSGRSDTEVLLASIEQLGVNATLCKLQGMFAFALWDREERTLFLARDRMGEKPLYYGWQGSVFMFASELKALKAHPSFIGEIDRDALALQLRHAFVPAPYSIFRGIRKLLPGTSITFMAEQCGSGTAEPEPRPYWSLEAVVEEGGRNPFPPNEEEALRELDVLLRDAVGRQMHADVPLGAFLSGGIDSSLIVALMQEQSAQRVKTFTVGFSEQGFNESGYAAAIATHLGTEHTELFVTAEEVLRIVPRLPELYDEPFADVSQIPTALIAGLTRKHVTVALSGDGGDELFGGYNRYLAASTFLPAAARFPRPLRTLAAGMLQVLPDRVMAALGARAGIAELGVKAGKFADLLRSSSVADYYASVTTFPENAYIPLDGADIQRPDCRFFSPYPQLPDALHAMMACDTVTYLPDDILVKVDRASMAAGLETRIPFLDHRVVEFAWRLPLSMKIRSGEGKRVLRRLLSRYVPAKLFERPKAGFAVPIDGWLRGPLREWAGDQLAASRLKRDGYLSADAVSKLWASHRSGRHDRSHEIWAILMFQAWLERERAA